MKHLHHLHHTTQAYKRSLTSLAKLSTHCPTHTYTQSHTHSTHPLITTPTHTSPVALPASYTSLGSVYVHWPYCRRRCSYCNFVKFIPRPGTHWTLPHNVLEDALVQELEHTISHSHITRVPSVFFGGGTPSLARPQMVEKVLRALQNKGYLLEDAEVTLEVNPTSIETQALRDFKEAGVNRVSIGVQSFDEASLSLLHRDHSAKEARNCLEAAQMLFPGRTSLDLMFGLPNHNVERWERELKEALLVGCDHLSLYQLTVERGTALHKQVINGEVILPDQDQMADLYAIAVQIAKEDGLYRYEVSNFARCESGESIHNKGYWQGQQYLGIGPGAHSRVVPQVCKSNPKPEGTGDNTEGSVNGMDINCETNDERTQSSSSGDAHMSAMELEVIREARINAADPANWLKETLKKGAGTRRTECQTRGVAAAEYLASGLRTRDGVTARQWKVFLPHLPHEEIFGGKIGWLADAGLLHVSPEVVCATDEGVAVLDAILPHLYNILHAHLR